MVLRCAAAATGACSLHWISCIACDILPCFVCLSIVYIITRALAGTVLYQLVHPEAKALWHTGAVGDNLDAASLKMLAKCVYLSRGASRSCACSNSGPMDRTHPPGSICVTVSRLTLPRGAACRSWEEKTLESVLPDIADSEDGMCVACMASRKAVPPLIQADDA